MPAPPTQTADLPLTGQNQAGLLETMLGKHGWLMADGATGTNLFAMGLNAGEAPELWNDRQPERIRALYNDCVDAGSDLFLTNSFGANAARLKLHGAGRRAHELSRISAEIAREVADRCRHTVIVAGSMGPTGELLEPLGPLNRRIAVEIFHEQADGLKAGGADILWIETISAIPELEAAAEACMAAGLGWCATMSFDTAGRTMMGVTPTALLESVPGFTARPAAVGANCGTGASDLLRSILEMSAVGADVPLIAKANAGIPKFVDGAICYDGSPTVMADFAVMARDSGAQIIGGCCGTTADHLRAMREALDTREPGPPPEPTEIEARTGAFSSTGVPADRGRRKEGVRRRRR